ncbi:hypothetical protein [Streptomyces pilosus]|uniref:Uncharacterized protein n=1 Tax=Streptomyces pilosus TaxID=28893 RepID=A0A918C6J4_9ACTN|nr:hypothetical protein [Streptomyces pilosus]GGR08251.1 hypothetical protein GCM10010280_65070 [Streptomyces pilosus]
MDGTPQSITVNPATGMLMIPAGEPKFALGVGLWDDTLEPFNTFIQRELLDAERQERNGNPSPAPLTLEGERLHVTVQLLPRPDNDYNPHAISVAAPPWHGGTHFERHLGYMYDRNLVSLGAALRSLATLTDRPLGCHAFVGITPCHRDEWDEDEYDPDDPEDAAHRVRGANGTEYRIGGPRLMLPWWEDLQKMAVDCARAVHPKQILGFIGHWTSWEPGAREALAQRTHDKEFAVTLRVEQQVVRVYYQDLCLSTLETGYAGYFDRTIQQVRELGGTATAQAEDHHGALQLFIEDSTPLTTGSTQTSILHGQNHLQTEDTAPTPANANGTTRSTSRYPCHPHADRAPALGQPSPPEEPDAPHSLEHCAPSTSARPAPPPTASPSRPATSSAPTTSAACSTARRPEAGRR